VIGPPGDRLFGDMCLALGLDLHLSWHFQQLRNATNAAMPSNIQNATTSKIGLSSPMSVGCLLKIQSAAGISAPTGPRARECERHAGVRPGPAHSTTRI